MYGWRARIGFVAPSRGDVLLYEFHRLAPAGVMAVPYSCELTKIDRTELERVQHAFSDGVRAMDREEVDLIALGGTPPQIFGGWSAYRSLVERLEGITSIPISTCLQAEIDAIQASGAERIALMTPHGSELNDRIVAAIEDHGIKVVEVGGPEVLAAYEISLVSEYDVYRQVKALYDRARRAGADGIHITCPRWPTLSMIPALESDCSVPVTASGIAQLWGAFSRLNLAPRAGNWGSLWARPHPSLVGPVPKGE